MTGSLYGRTVVVTGAGRGLGLAMARDIGAAGARVYLAELDVEFGKAAEKHLREQGFEARFIGMDVADPDSVAEGVDGVRADGEIDGLVNNAGLADAVGGKWFHEISVEEWDRMMAVNARGPWLVSRAVLPSMRAAGAGRIVNIASDAALYGSPRLAHYVAAKGAVIALTRSMARELGDERITVNAVAPGLTVTESTQRIPAERHELYRRGRAISDDELPEDVAGTVTFLLGPRARYLTGQLLVVNGGFVMH